MDDESFIGAFGDVPTDLAGDYGQLYIFRAEDFGAWYRRVRDAHEREVDGGVDAMTDAEHDRRMESQRQNYRRLIDGGRS